MITTMCMHGCRSAWKGIFMCISFNLISSISFNIMKLSWKHLVKYIPAWNLPSALSKLIDLVYQLQNHTTKVIDTHVYFYLFVYIYTHVQSCKFSLDIAFIDKWILKLALSKRNMSHKIQFIFSRDIYTQFLKSIKKQVSSSNIFHFTQYLQSISSTCKPQKNYKSALRSFS